MGSDAGTSCGLDHRLDRGGLCRRRPRPEERRIVGVSLAAWAAGPADLAKMSRILGVHEQQAAELGDLGCRPVQASPVQRRKLRHARIGQEAFEAAHASPVQAGAIKLVIRHRAAPERDVDPALPVRRSPLQLK